ncbi:MAG: hypothetical protein AAEJ04_06140, partial [Planctomycetota bacterium]
MSHALGSVPVPEGLFCRLGKHLLRQISAQMLFLLLFCGFSTDAVEAYSPDVSRSKAKLAAAIQQERFDAASHAVDELIQDGSKKAIEALIQVGFAGDFYGVERYIGSKLVGIDTGPAFDRMCELATKDKRPAARIILTLVLSARKE